MLSDSNTNKHLDTDTQMGKDEVPAVPGEMGSDKRGRPDYYEAWHQPIEDESRTGNLHSPNYHYSTIGEDGIPARQMPAETENTNKRKIQRYSKLIRSSAMVLVCALAGTLCGFLTATGCLKSYEHAKNSLSSDENAETVVVSSDTNSGSSQVALSVSGDTLQPEEIYELATEQCVGIQVTSKGYNVFGQLTASSPATGSGFIVSDNGYIVTNYHVIENALSSDENSITVQTFDGTSYAAELTGYDADEDIAVLKINAEGLNAVTVGSMDSCKVGNTIYAVGNPLGELTYTMTDGIICALNRVISTDTSYAINAFQINAAVNSGNSGGPVYNSRGEVIGIVDAKYSATGVEGLGFAIPLDDAVETINDLIANGYVTGKAYLGVQVRTITGTVAAYYNLTEGAYIEYMVNGSCAEKAGLRAGDIITRIGEYSIQTADGVRVAKSAYVAGDTVEVEYFRDGESYKTELTFDEETGDTNNPFNGAD